MNIRSARRRVRVAVAILAAVATGAAGATAVVAATSTSETLTAARWAITIDGYEIASFQELQGISSEIEPADYWETNDDGIQLNKLPGKFKPPTITLKRGMNGSMELWSWHEAVRLGTMAAARRSVSLTAFNSEGRPVVKYWLENAWPSKMDLAGLKAGSSTALMETVTLVCEHIQRVSP